MKKYTVPKKAAESEYTDRKSVFLGHLCPVSGEEEAIRFIEKIRKEYSDARHNVWAYCLPDGRFRFSDDGEPAGTGGAPVLECMTKRGITGCVIVVTRYFGGILLGTGGLVHAYTTAASDALTAAGTAEIVPYRRCAVNCPYALFGKVSKLAERFGAREIKADFSENVSAGFLILPEKVSALEKELSESSSGTLSLEILGEESVRAEED